MDLRCRRSLPTEKARSPAPVRITTRTAVRTAIVSTISVRRAPISVVIALSACGRLRVTSATRPPSRWSRSTGSPVSSPSAGGGPKSSAFHRSVPDGLIATRSSPFGAERSCVQLRQPAHGLDAWREEVLPASRHDEGRQVLQLATDRTPGDGEAARPVARSDERVLLEWRADEDAVVEPLGLDELELTLEMCPGEHEDDPSIGAVVLELAVGQHGSVARPAPDHAMQPYVDAPVLVQGVTGVGPPRVRADRALEPTGIIGEEKVVVAPGIGTELGVVAVRCQGERSTALPSPDHLRAESIRVGAARRPVAQVASVGTHLRVQLPEDDVRAVAPQDLRCRRRRELAGLVGVAEDDLAGLESWFPGTGAGPTTAFDRGLADAVLEAEGGTPSSELVAVLTPEHLDPRQLLVGSACLVSGLLELSGVVSEKSDGHVHVATSERRLPVLRTALTDVAEQRGACRHPFTELRREAVQRGLRDAQSLEAAIGEPHGHRRVVPAVGRPRVGGDPMQSPDQLTSVCPVRDAQHHICTDVGRGTLEQRTGLDVVDLELGMTRVGPGFTCLPALVVLRGRGRVLVGRRQVREGARGRARGRVYTVADDRPVAAVDELGEDLVHHVVVQGASTAGLVRLTASSCELDVEERPSLDIRPGDVDDEEVGEDKVGQRVVAISVRRPVHLAVKAVPEG